jgi:hypothetical protein
MSMWTADDYRDAARDATDVRTRRALADEADRIERREQSRSTVRVEVTIR